MTFFGKITEWFKDLFEEDDHYTVTVKKGDSLWKIAADITGDGRNWTKIAAANPERGWDENYVIQPGEVLRIPKE